MKKKLQLLTIGFLTSGLSLIAQPILTATGNNMIVGDIFPFKDCNFINPGPSGANQNWNLGAMTTNSTTSFTVTSVASTPNGASFSGANISFNNGNGLYEYFNTSATALQNFGIVTGTTIISYSNPEDILHYPFSFNNTFSDPWSTTFISNTISFTRTGTSNVTYDGYGSLTLPIGTFNNVVRVHLTKTYTDTYFAGTINYYDEIYSWYLNGTHHEIASVYTLSNNVAPTVTQGGSYINVIPTSINQNSNVNTNFSGYPNPAQDNYYLNSTNGKIIEKIEICDLAGKIIYSENQEVNNQQTIKINTYNFAPGIYTVKIFTKDEAVEIKKLLKTGI
ncbi:MAG: T9SS type A sorting domain-containing protein [Bacteroidota bacterium]|nr:T9SS type A sorting domain-containing protein [Bacteroidota bacterium]MDP3145991.1 T9SS type A sorting domain-containing protein [Bacteroidota bacterium]